MKNVIKIKFIWVLLTTFEMIALYGCNRALPEQNQEAVNFESAYQLLNQDLFGKDSMQWLDDMLKQEIFLYSEEVKGEFVEAQNEESIFPAKLISALEKMIYKSLDSSLNKFTWEDIQESIYFETMKEFGAEDFEVDLEELMNLFPVVMKNADVEDVYEAYKLVSGESNCEEMFHLHMTDDQDNYVFVINSGGSAGTVSVVLTKRVDDEFIVISQFETQNSGYGRVIQFANEFYYIFPEYNYNLKNYDGVRIYKLGDNVERENLKIKYLPYYYVWKNIYNTSEGTVLDDYLESIKDDITSDEYLENGKAEEIYVYYGDEEETNDFIVPENDERYISNEYYKTDLANTGVPVYMRKSNLVPSSYRDIWHLRSVFYIQNPEDDSIRELDKLEIGYYAPIAGEAALVQMWFKRMEEKVYTCCLYHVSDYNYVLTVFLLEGDQMIRIRTDMICPQRHFVLTESIVNEDSSFSEQAVNDTSESVIKWDEALYQEYEDNLINNDGLREANSIYGEKWNDTDEGYRELWGESYFGQLGAHGQVGTEKNIFLEGEPMTGILEAEVIEEDLMGMRIVTCDEMGAAEYIYYDSGDLQYFSCKGLEKREWDLPEYVVCYGVFEQNRVSDECQDEKWKDFKEKYGQKISGDLEEYCIIENHIYAIDREKEALANVSDDLPGYVGKWLRQEAKRVCCGMKVTSERFEDAAEILPQGYFAADIGICDLNKDGLEDYVIVVYQSDEEEPLYDRNADDEIWMYLSDPDGNYTKRVLLSDILFQCATLKFVSEGMLMCENIVGNEGYGIDPCRVDYFYYDKEMEDFCLYKAYQGKNGDILIYDKEALGKLTVEEYYQTQFNEIKAGNTYNVMEMDIYCEYLDSRVMSGSINDLDCEMPVIIDVKSNSLLNITEMIPKEEMIQICRMGMKDMYRNKLSQDDVEVYIRYIEEAYDEKSEEKVNVYFKITSWGVCIVCVDKSENDGEIKRNSVMIDKEFFINTCLWDYIEPNF